MASLREWIRRLLTQPLANPRSLCGR